MKLNLPFLYLILMSIKSTVKYFLAFSGITEVSHMCIWYWKVGLLDSTHSVSINLLPSEDQIEESLHHPSAISYSPLLLRMKNKRQEGNTFKNIYREAGWFTGRYDLFPGRKELWGLQCKEIFKDNVNIFLVAFNLFDQIVTPMWSLDLENALLWSNGDRYSKFHR